MPHLHRALHLALITTAVMLLSSGCGGSPATPGSTTPAAIPTSAPTSTRASTRAPVAGVPVRIPTEDGAVQLEGTLYGMNSMAVIFSNMGAQRQETWNAIAPDIAADGYMVLTYNMRYWVTETQIEDSLRSKASDDLRAAIAFARGKGASNIVLVGASLGGMATAKVAAAEKAAAVVIMAAPMSPPGLDFHVEEAEVKQITAPKLFIYSENETTEISNGLKQMYGLAPQPKEIYAYPGSAHGTDLFEGEHRADVVRRIKAFIKSQAPPLP